MNLTNSPITVAGELNVFLQAYQSALNAGFTSAEAEGIVIAEFTASTLGAQGANLGLTPSDLATFQQQQAAALNRTTKSGDYADATVTAPALVPATIGDPAWVASQNLLVGVTSDPNTVTAQDVKLAAATAANNPALITPLPIALTLTADSLVNINAVGQTAAGPAIDDTLGFVSLHPALGRNELVTIGGDTNLTIGTTATGAVADFTGGLLNINNLTITDTNTAAVTLVGSTAAPSAPFASLDFTVPGDSVDIGYSTNAVAIDATNSGGIIMQAGDANFVTSATVAGSAGDVFKGSTTAGDVFGGSIGNDSFTLQQGGAAETIYTGGGQDTIALFAGHTGLDHVEFYAGFNTSAATLAATGVEIPRDISGSITQGNDAAQLGWWGLATGATETGI